MKLLDAYSFRDNPVSDWEKWCSSNPFFSLCGETWYFFYIYFLYFIFIKHYTYCFILFLIMQNITFIAYVLCIILTIYWIIKIISFFWVTKHYAKIKEDIPKYITINKNKKLVYILPVYQETVLMKDTIDHYMPYLSENIQILIIWTAKERDKEGKNTTLDIAKKYTNKHISIIEYPNQYGFMAHQVNYWVEYLIKQWYDPSKTFVHMLNIDSRLSKQYLSEVVKNINNNKPIMLQTAMYTSNFEKSPLLLKWVGIVQSRRTITGEQRRILLNSYVSNLKLYHVVGHGLIITIEKFIKYKWFPENTFTEDMHYGYYLSINKEKIQPIVSNEIADIPTNMRWWRNQAQVRFIGAMEYHAYLKSYLSKFKKTLSLRVVIMTIQGFYNAFKRLCISYIIRFLLFAILFSWSLSLLIASIIWLSIYMTHYWLTIEYLYKNKYIKDKKLSYLFSSFIIVAIRSFPPTLALIKYISWKLGIFTYVKYKTPHE